MIINHPEKLKAISLHTTHSFLQNYSGLFILESFVSLVRKGYICIYIYMGPKLPKEISQ